MKNPERITPVAAVVSAVLSMACCLPFALPVALGVAGLSVMLDTLRPWLIAGSLALLGLGFFQLSRKRACGRRSKGSLILFGVATLIVLSFTFLPQVIASWLAGSLEPRTDPLRTSARGFIALTIAGAALLRSGSVSAGSSSSGLAVVDAASLPRLKAEFNADPDAIRIVLLLSPT